MTDPTENKTGDKPRPQNKNLKRGGSPGRPKGQPNKISSLAKDNIIAVFDKLGGVDKMVVWAEEHQTDFYRIYARLMPIQVEGTGEDGAVIIKIVKGLGDDPDGE